VVLSLPQSYIVKPFATILKDLPQPCWHWLTGGTFDSATGGTFQSDTDGTFNSDIHGTFESDMGGTFKVLQSSNSKDWFIDNELSYDKSSIEYKRAFIADLAKVLVEHKMTMAGNELRELFNKNGINTSNGSPYSNSPSHNRGIHTVISSTWKYYESIGDHQTAYNIARAFVNQYNAYAYE
jgi:hypothetical protein